MEKKQKLESNLVELETKYQNLIQGLDKLIKLRDDTIKDNQQVIDDVSLKIIDKEKLCDELLNADIKMMVNNMKYKYLVLLTLIVQAVFGVILMPETIEFIIQIMSVGALESILYFAETYKDRKLLKKHDYFSEYKELQDLYEIKKWREFHSQKLHESKEVHVAKKAKYQEDLEQIKNVLADLLSLNILLVNEPHVIDAQYTQIMSLIREKKEQLNDQNY